MQRRFDGVVERIASVEAGGLEPDRLRDLYSLAQDAACETWCEVISDDAWVHAARSWLTRVARS
ncbi:MAG: hypothetical protein WB500_03965 [Rhodoplanes sp.]